MDGTQVQLTRLTGIFEDADEVAALLDELAEAARLRDGLEPFGGFGCGNDAVITREITRRDVETRQSVGQPFGGKIGNDALEMTKDASRLGGVLGFVDLLVIGRAGDHGEGTPITALRIDDVVLAILGGNDARKLPDPVGLIRFGLDTAVGVVGHGLHVRHDCDGILEDRLVDALEDELLLRESRAQDDPVGIVDVACSDRPQGDEAPGDIELGGDGFGDHGKRGKTQVEAAYHRLFKGKAAGRRFYFSPLKPAISPQDGRARQ